MHVSTAAESKMYYSLGTNVGDVTRPNVANVVRFSLYIKLPTYVVMLTLK